VQSIAKRPIYDQQTHSRTNHRPIIGWMLVFKDASGIDLHSMSDDLHTRRDYLRVVNYLFQRFPVETEL